MDIEEDLYGEFGIGAEKKASRNEQADRAAAAEAALAQLATAQAQIAALTAANQKLIAANRIYKNNLSTLFVTAKAEIDRKNDTIRELRASASTAARRR